MWWEPCGVLYLLPSLRGQTGSIYVLSLYSAAHTNFFYFCKYKNPIIPIKLNQQSVRPYCTQVLIPRNRQQGKIYLLLLLFNT